MVGLAFYFGGFHRGIGLVGSVGVEARGWCHHRVRAHFHAVAGGALMPRPGYRVRLESGLNLDLNQLTRRGFIQPGATTGPVGITWTNSYFDEEIASGTITADMSGPNGPHGWLRIQIGGLDQHIHLVAYPRHFGGRQWYFICPYLSRRVSVLWMPPGARDFACRQWWGRQVAYASQFSTPVDRAHRGKARINSRLCSDWRPRS